jgi:hypothetical protein
MPLPTFPRIHSYVPGCPGSMTAVVALLSPGRVEEKDCAVDGVDCYLVRLDPVCSGRIVIQ